MWASVTEFGNPCGVTFCHVWYLLRTCVDILGSFFFDILNNKMHCSCITFIYFFFLPFTFSLFITLSHSISSFSFLTHFLCTHPRSSYFYISITVTRNGDRNNFFFYFWHSVEKHTNILKIKSRWSKLCSHNYTAVFESSLYISSSKEFLQTVCDLWTDDASTSTVSNCVAL